MPRLVDTDARRALILAALWHLAAREGLGAATVRTVAAEAGLSLGAVTRTFPSTDDLHVAALRLVHEQVRARLDASPPSGSAVDAAAAALEQAMPLDTESRAEAAVYYAYLERARSSSPASAVLREVADEVDEALLRLSRRAVRAVTTGDPGALGHALVEPGLCAQLEARAREVHALTEGLAFGLVTWPERRSPDDARRVLRTWLERLAQEAP